MDVVKFEIQNWTDFVVTLNIVGVLILIALTGAGAFLMKKLICFIRKFKIKSIVISEATIGIGDSSVTIKYDKKIQEIAYKIWVELKTRKIGLMFEEDNDVIVEIYNSWYTAFGSIRGLLKEVPAERIDDANGLIKLTTDVLNEGLRPHLTKWQAKYRCWYDSALEENKENKEGLSPQELQRRYPEYECLISELKKTNEIMLNFADELKRIVYDQK